MSDGISDHERTSIPTGYLDRLQITPKSETKLKKMVSIRNQEEQNKTRKQIDDIWAKYDTNKSNVLEKSEALIFLGDVFREVFGSESK